MNEHRLHDYLDHIQQAASDACGFVDGLNKEDFLEDKRTQQAVIMSLIIMGEAVTKLMDRHAEFIQAHAQVPWRSMRGMRNRIAHGYFVLSAAAGLFVSPAPGPVLANYGLDNLRFVAPVAIGDTIRARLTCKRKVDRNRTDEQGRGQGVVAWDVQVTNQHDELVASYDILTLVQKRG